MAYKKTNAKNTQNTQKETQSMIDKIWDWIGSVDKRLKVVLGLAVTIISVWTLFGLPTPGEINDKFNNVTVEERLDELENNELVTAGILRSVLREITHTNPDGSIITLYQLPVNDSLGNPTFDYIGKQGDKLLFIDCCEWLSAIYNSERDMYGFIDFSGQWFWITANFNKEEVEKMQTERKLLGSFPTHSTK